MSSFYSIVFWLSLQVDFYMENLVSRQSLVPKLVVHKVHIVHVVHIVHYIQYISNKTRHSYKQMLLIAGQTAGPIELNFLWTLMGGRGCYFFSTSNAGPQYLKNSRIQRKGRARFVDERTDERNAPLHKQKLQQQNFSVPAPQLLVSHS